MDMTIGERIKEIRMHADNGNKLTLEKFGNRISLTNQAISAMESGRANPSNATIDLICREFNVSKEWLLTGKGEMNDLPENEEIKMLMQFSKRTDLPANILKAAIKYYLMLDEAGRDLLEERIDEAIKKSRK